MGAWGPGIYQNDVAEDIKSEYIDLLHKGKTKEEASDEVIWNNEDYLYDEDDAIPMILALADTEWKYGKLIDRVKEKALFIINTGRGLKVWEENPKYLKKRKEVLQKLKEKLESPQPPEKQIKPVRLYKCEWKMKDAYAYKMESDLAKEKGLYGKYIIFIKVGERIWYPGHIIPIVWAKLTNSGQLPTTEEELNKLEFVQISSDDYISLFSHLHLESHNKNRKNIESLKYSINKNYELPVYRTELISTSKRIIPKKLIYLGNFPNIIQPKYEFLLMDKISYYSMTWKNVEKDIIERYYFNNKEEKYINEISRRKRNEIKSFLEEKGYNFNRIEQ